MSKQTFLAYWQGYHPDGNTLEDTPEGVDIVALAFAVNGDDPEGRGETITTTYLTSQHSEKEIRAGIADLKERGIRVIVSVNGKPDWTGHDNGWDIKDPANYARNVGRLLGDWGLDGIDLDNEITNYAPGDNFIAVIRELRAALGRDALITIPVYLEESSHPPETPPNRDAYLAEVRDQISFVSTMAYWKPMQGQISLFEKYAALVGDAKVMIGVSNGSQSTDPGIVAELAGWDPVNKAKKGIMFWFLNAQSLAETRKWCETISSHLPQLPPQLT